MMQILHFPLTTALEVSKSSGQRPTRFGWSPARNRSQGRQRYLRNKKYIPHYDRVCHAAIVRDAFLSVHPV